MLDFVMNKKQFEILVIITFLLSMLGAFYDLFWADDATKKIFEFSEKFDFNLSQLQYDFIKGLHTIASACFWIGFTGLLSYWNPSRFIFLAGLIIYLPTEIFLGTQVSSGPASFIFEIRSISTGVVLAIVFFTPIKQFYLNKSESNQENLTKKFS